MDAGLVDAAIVERLANDAALTALCPGGVYWATAPPGLTAVVVVAVQQHDDTPALDGDTLYERTVYTVKAVIQDTGGTTARQAAARIHALLHNADLDLAAADYAAMTCRRIRRLRLDPSRDPADPAAIWQQVGGLYELWSYPTGPVTLRERIEHATPTR
jgi:hypothetical protein